MTYLRALNQRNLSKGSHYQLRATCILPIYGSKNYHIMEDASIIESILIQLIVKKGHRATLIMYIIYGAILNCSQNGSKPQIDF